MRECNDRGVFDILLLLHGCFHRVDRSSGDATGSGSSSTNDCIKVGTIKEGSGHDCLLVDGRMNNDNDGG